MLIKTPHNPAINIHDINKGIKFKGRPVSFHTKSIKAAYIGNNRKDCKTKSYVDIGKDPESQKKYKISSVPTIIIFKDGEEVARFQADLSFKMAATREEVQEEIDNQLMSDF